MKETVGGWVTGDDFWGRDIEKELFQEKLERSANILILAQRRMGKTSLMKDVMRIISNKFYCVYADLEDSFSSEDFIAELSVAIKEHKSLWSKVKDGIISIYKIFVELSPELQIYEVKVSLRKALTPSNWRQKGNEVFDILSKAEKPVVLFLDEVPILVNRMLKGKDFRITDERKKTTDEFMHWLRKMSIEYQDKVMIVISGSIGLEPVLSQAQLSSSINNFARFELKAWDKETALGCLNELAKNYNLTFKDKGDEKFVELLSYLIPYHVQLFFSCLHDNCRMKKTSEILIEDIERVFQEDMLKAKGNAEMAHYEDRLKLVFGNNLFTLVTEILAETAINNSLSKETVAAFKKIYGENRAVTKEGTISEIIVNIIGVLEHDGYLRAKGNGYVFLSPLMRNWFKKKYSVSYMSVLGGAN